MDIQPSPGDRQSRNAKVYFARLPRDPSVRAARRAGALGADEQVLAAIRIDKFSRGAGLLVLLLSILLTLIALKFLPFWFAPLSVVVLILWTSYLGRTSYLYVTDRRVVLTSFIYVHLSRTRTTYSLKSFENVLSLERPVYGLPDVDPNRFRFRPSRVTLPPPFASFLGRETVYVSMDTVTDYAFRVAMTPPPNRRRR